MELMGVRGGSQARSSKVGIVWHEERGYGGGHSAKSLCYYPIVRVRLLDRMVGVSNCLGMTLG